MEYAAFLDEVEQVVARDPLAVAADADPERPGL